MKSSDVNMPAMSDVDRARSYLHAAFEKQQRARCSKRHEKMRPPVPLGACAVCQKADCDCTGDQVREGGRS